MILQIEVPVRYGTVPPGLPGTATTVQVQGNKQTALPVNLYYIRYSYYHIMYILKLFPVPNTTRNWATVV